MRVSPPSTPPESSAKPEQAPPEAPEAYDEIGYHLFQADGASYLYDTSTNGIVPISQAVATILADYLAHGADAVRGAYATVLPAEELAEAIAWLEHARGEMGMLRPFLRKDFDRIHQLDTLRRALENRIVGLILNVTEECNQRCTYCIYSGHYEGERTHRGRHMDWETARKAIDFFIPRADRKNEVDIAFYGGEALLRWDVVRRSIEYAKSLTDRDDLAFSISTNLTLLTEEMADFLVAHKILISISLDGPKEIHDAARVLTNGEGTHDRVMAALRMLHDRDPDYLRDHLMIQTTLDRRNDIRAVLRFFRGELFEGALGQVNTLRADDADNYAVTPEQQARHQANLDQLVEDYIRHFEAESEAERAAAERDFPYSQFNRLMGGVFSTIIRRDLGPGRRRIDPNRSCIPGVRNLLVDPDGHFHACEKLDQDGMEIGHVDTGFDIEKIRGMLTMFSDFCDNHCQTCWAYRLCGHCLVQFLDKGGFTVERKRKNCAREQRRLARDLERFVHIWTHEPASAASNPFTLHGIHASRQAEVEAKAAQGRAE